MTYVKTSWQDRVVDKPLTYTLQDNGDGTVTLVPAPGTVTQEGTPLNATNLNKIEQGVADALPKDGSQAMTGPLEIANGAPWIKLVDTGTGKVWYLGVDGQSLWIREDTTAGENQRFVLGPGQVGWSEENLPNPANQGDFAHFAGLRNESGYFSIYSYNSTYGEGEMQSFYDANGKRWHIQGRDAADALIQVLLEVGNIKIGDPSRWNADGKFGLDMNNSDIVGANTIFMSDTATGSEGMAFLKNGASSGSTNNADYNVLAVQGDGSLWAGATGLRDNGGVLEMFTGGAWKPVGGVKSVQRGITSVIDSQTVNVAISSVDVSKSFITVSEDSYDDTSKNKTRVRLTSATNLELHNVDAVAGSTKVADVSWEVVESY